MELLSVVLWGRVKFGWLRWSHWNGNATMKIIPTQLWFGWGIFGTKKDFRKERRHRRGRGGKLEWELNWTPNKNHPSYPRPWRSNLLSCIYYVSYLSIHPFSPHFHCHPWRPWVSNMTSISFREANNAVQDLVILQSTGPKGGRQIGCTRVTPFSTRARPE